MEDSIFLSHQAESWLIKESTAAWSVQATEFIWTTDFERVPVHYLLYVCVAHVCTDVLELESVRLEPVPPQRQLFPDQRASFHLTATVYNHGQTEIENSQDNRGLLTFRVSDLLCYSSHVISSNYQMNSSSMLYSVIMPSVIHAITQSKQPQWMLLYSFSHPPPTDRCAAKGLLRWYSQLLCCPPQVFLSYDATLQVATDPELTVTVTDDSLIKSTKLGIEAGGSRTYQGTVELEVDLGVCTFYPK